MLMMHVYVSVMTVVFSKTMKQLVLPHTANLAPSCIAWCCHLVTLMA